MQLTITSNAEIVRQGLQDLSGEPIKIGRRKIFEAMNRITREMEAYPPERPGQKYERTGRLGFAWKVKSLGDGYTISNDVRSLKTGKTYAKYVVGSARGSDQAWMHKGRWLLLRDVVEKEVEKLPPEIAKEIVMVARSKGLKAQ
jgi:hypothetical protein